MKLRSERVCVMFSVLCAGFLMSIGARASAGTLPAASAPQKIIIDSDPGTDDALAILLAIYSPEVEVKGISVVAGNVTAQMGFEDALRVLSLAGRCDIPVAKGAEHPLLQRLVTGTYWNGANGLGGAETPPSKCDGDKRFGPDLIIDLVHRYPHEIVIVPIGPLTNVALAVRKDPSIVPLVNGVVLMGGSISGGNVNGAAEYNIYQDPEAASIVFNAGSAGDHGWSRRHRKDSYHAGRRRKSLLRSPDPSRILLRPSLGIKFRLVKRRAAGLCMTRWL